MRTEKEDMVSKSSEEVQDIIDRMPSRTGRTVTIIVTVLAGFLIMFGWLIEYPEKVSGPVSITARQAPVKLVANSSGKLHLLKADTDTIKEDQIIAVIDNPANINDVLKIEKYFEESTPELLFAEPEMVVGSAMLSLGELSPQFSSFMNAVENLMRYRSQKPYEKKIEGLSALLGSQLETRRKNLEQLKTKNEILRLSEKNIQRDSSLFLSSAIAESDVDRSAAGYLGVLESRQSLEKENTAIGIQIDDTRNKIDILLLEQKETEARLKMELFSTYNEMVSSLRKWKLSYCFISPIRGSLEYLNFWRENDFVAAGTDVFSVLPNDNPILGQVYLPSMGAGKVSVGQDVIIKLDNYPYIEFGSISGKVKTISELSNKVQLSQENSLNTYLITVDLPSSLVTNYGANLGFSYELKGIADILTKRRKLIERLFDNLKYIASEK